MRYGLTALCIGMGMGAAVLWETTVTRPTEFKLNRVETERGPLALVTIDNGEDWTKPCTFGREALESLGRGRSTSSRSRSGPGSC